MAATHVNYKRTGYWRRKRRSLKLQIGELINPSRRVISRVPHCNTWTTYLSTKRTFCRNCYSTFVDFAGNDKPRKNETKTSKSPFSSLSLVIHVLFIAHVTRYMSFYTPVLSLPSLCSSLCAAQKRLTRRTARVTHYPLSHLRPHPAGPVTHHCGGHNSRWYSVTSHAITTKWMCQHVYINGLTTYKKNTVLSTGVHHYTILICDKHLD